VSDKCQADGVIPAEDVALSAAKTVASTYATLACALLSNMPPRPPLMLFRNCPRVLRSATM